MAINFFYHPAPPDTNDAGFSLIELLIVVAIIAVMGAVAMPNFSPANARLKQAARELYGNLQRARMEAIKTNQDVGIIFDTANNRYILCQNFNGDADCNDAGETAITTINLGNYGSTVQYGYGSATKNATTPSNSSSNSCPANCADNGVSYTSNIVNFKPTGRGSIGYVYLQNRSNISYVLGTPSLAGVVVMKKWVNGSWQ